MLVAVVTCLLLAITSPAFGCDCETCAAAAGDMPLQSKYDFFTNYGNYMPRIHCLRTAEGTPDWPWITALIALNLIVVTGYLKIVFFWRACYMDENPEDRNSKLMGLAWIFVMCAVCGYGLSTLIFFWPVYRMLAIALAILAVFTWRFAIDLEPFRNSFTAHRLQRQLNEALKRDNWELESKNHQLEVSHRKQAEMAEALKKTNEDLDEFVYAASHDLKAPLRAVDSLSQFLLEDLPNDIPENCREDLGEMRGRIKRMENMLAAMLNYARMGRQQHAVETFAVADVARDAVELLCIPIEFRVEIDIQDLSITAPRPPLEQVIRNLIDNAAKHHDRSDGTIRVTAVELEEFVEISVADNGPGIDPEFHKRVFLMFETLRRRDEHDSSGMGLAMVKRLVEGQGGRICVESDLPSSEQRGTTFRFTWPKNVQPELGEIEPDESISPTPVPPASEESPLEVCHV